MEIKQQHLILLGLVAIILLIAGGGIVSYEIYNNVGRPTAIPASLSTVLPEIELTPPLTLPEIAATIRPDYPELADLLENPELETVYKDFYLAYQNGGKEAALTLARQRHLLNRDDQIIMTLVLNTDDSDALISELQAEGVIVNGHYQNLVNIAIPIALIETQLQSQTPDLVVERIANLDHVIRLEFPKQASIQQSITHGQGVGVSQAGHWHEQGFIGQGVKIGVLDLGFAGYEALLGQELPETVTVAKFGDAVSFSDEPHGTACAEIIHEIAPGAELYLVYYDGTDVAMGQAVDWLISQGVHIISNSTNSIGTTPLDGTGFSVDLVDKAYDNGILWVNSAGNYAERHYRGRFQDVNNDNYHDFGAPDKQVLPFKAGTDGPTRIVLAWDDWDEVTQDYDLLLYSGDGQLLAKSEEPQTGEVGQEPIEGFIYTFDEEAVYLLSIENYAGAADGQAMFDLFVEPSIIHPDYVVREYSLGSPADALNVLAVGATYWSDDRLEPYSSRGPTNDGRVKPDISAPASIDTASYNPETFPGTSAATPHVAAAAALVKQAFPDFQPNQIKQFLIDRAIDLGELGHDNRFGAGRLNLGRSPTDPSIPVEAAPLPSVSLRPTSTPSLPAATLTFGFDDFAQPNNPAIPQIDTFFSTVIVVGICLICVAALLLFGLVVAIVAMFL